MTVFCQSLQVTVERNRLFQLRGSMTKFGQARDWRAEAIAASGKDQPVIGQSGRCAVRRDNRDGRSGAVDRLHATGTMVHLGRGKQVGQGRHHLLGLALIKAGTDDKGGLRRYHSNRQRVRADTFLIAQARCSECGHHSGKT